MELREAGQYLKEKNNNHNINFIINVANIIYILSFFTWYYFSYIIKINYFLFLIIMIILMISSRIFIKKYDKKINDLISNNEKWIKWEKEVAYQLNILQAKYNNIYILNDFQHEKVWNIDHIIISEKWIFTIETKNYKNIYDIEKLKIINQAKHEAWVLKEILEKDFWINWVTPILTFIWQDIEVNIKIDIVNPEKIENIYINSRNKIEPYSVKKIFLYLNDMQQT